MEPFSECGNLMRSAVATSCSDTRTSLHGRGAVPGGCGKEPRLPPAMDTTHQNEVNMVVRAVPVGAAGGDRRSSPATTRHVLGDLWRQTTAGDRVAERGRRTRLRKLYHLKFGEKREVFAPRWIVMRRGCGGVRCCQSKGHGDVWDRQRCSLL